MSAVCSSGPKPSHWKALRKISASKLFAWSRNPFFFFLFFFFWSRNPDRWKAGEKVCGSLAAYFRVL